MTREEFKSGVLPLKNKLYRFALRMLGDAEEAQDAVQEIFLRLWSKRERLNEYRNIEAFAMTMIRNYCLDQLKSPASRKDKFDDNRQMPDYKTPYASTESHDTMRLVKMAMDELPEQQRMVIHMRDIEECDFDEIAEVTGLSLNNLRVTLSRARKKIRDTLIKVNNYEFSQN